MPGTATWRSGLPAPAVNLRWKPLSTCSPSPWAATWVTATYLNVEAGNVNPKGNQSWVFIGRTDFEAETPILWQPDAKSWLIWKDPGAGKDWEQEEKGTTEDEMVGWHHLLMGLGVLGSWWWTGRPGMLQFMGLQRIRHDWATELNWTGNWILHAASNILHAATKDLACHNECWRSHVPQLRTITAQQINKCF